MSAEPIRERKGNRGRLCEWKAQRGRICMWSSMPYATALYPQKISIRATWISHRAEANSRQKFVLNHFRKWWACGVEGKRPGKSSSRPHQCAEMQKHYSRLNQKRSVHKSDPAYVSIRRHVALVLWWWELKTTRVVRTNARRDAKHDVSTSGWKQSLQGAF